MEEIDHNPNFTITETCERLNTKRSTVISYLNHGYIPYVRRDRRGHRYLQLWQLNLLDVLIHMRQAGFPTKDLRRYSRLFRQGRQTVDVRLAMLTTRKHQLRNVIEAAQKSIDFIERQEEIERQGLTLHRK